MELNDHIIDAQTKLKIEQLAQKRGLSLAQAAEEHFEEHEQHS
jgi:hypothetical protein